MYFNSEGLNILWHHTGEKSDHEIRKYDWRWRTYALQRRWSTDFPSSLLLRSGTEDLRLIIVTLMFLLVQTCKRMMETICIFDGIYLTSSWNFILFKLVIYILFYTWLICLKMLPSHWGKKQRLISGNKKQAGLFEPIDVMIGGSSTGSSFFLDHVSQFGSKTVLWVFLIIIIIKTLQSGTCVYFASLSCFISHCVCV